MTLAVLSAGGSGSGAASPARGHLYAVDVMRVITVAGVIAVHVVSFSTTAGNVAAGALTIILHVNREVFFALMALVLTYSSDGRPGWTAHGFWTKRCWLVVTPYVVWTLIYYFADGDHVTPFGHAAQQVAHDLLTGAARYHLYFLLVTLQLYAVFPALLWLLRKTRRHHVALLAISFAGQLALTTAMHYDGSVPGVLRPWFDYRDQWLPGYQLYVIAGGAAAFHLPELTAWVRDHERLIVRATVVVLTLGVGSYFLDHDLGGMTPRKASEVFSPAVVFETCAVLVGMYALGVHWADRRKAGRVARGMAAGSDASFGIYLAHPLLLQGLLAFTASVGGLLAAGHLSSAIVLPVDLLLVVPFLYGLTALLVLVLRRTPFSVPLAGRRR